MASEKKAPASQGKGKKPTSSLNSFNIDLKNALELIDKIWKGRSEAELSREVGRSRGWVSSLRREFEKGKLTQSIRLDCAESLANALGCQFLDIKGKDEVLYNPFEISDPEKAKEELVNRLEKLKSEKPQVAIDYADILDSPIEFGAKALAKERFDDLMKDESNYEFLALLLDYIYWRAQSYASNNLSNELNITADEAINRQNRFRAEKEEILQKVGAVPPYLYKSFRDALPSLDESWWIYLYFSEYLREISTYLHTHNGYRFTNTEYLKERYRDSKQRIHSKNLDADSGRQRVELYIEALQRILEEEVDNLPREIGKASIRRSAEFLQRYFEGNKQSAGRVEKRKKGIL